VIVGVTVSPQGTVAGGLGRAQRVAVADVRDGVVEQWAEHHVGWGDLHGTGPEGTHHARIVRFVREHGIECVVTSGLGEGMRTTMAKLGVDVRTDLVGDARAAAVAAATTPVG
jgi:predicted Fe-Mo cluster-binding NifX family protein